MRPFGLVCQGPFLGAFKWLLWLSVLTARGFYKILPISGLCSTTTTNTDYNPTASCNVSNDLYVYITHIDIAYVKGLKEREKAICTCERSAFKNASLTLSMNK